ncbi:hypothetical protein [Myceligenerans salitolerans]|uniref:Gram-positive cocci surface proteins LPxTG domain-containing protein n=1 Tax=Myceligenerans salitolerans TaxID=1230528 RepID=A0ABS3IBC5_9MICO|nr:hypothetical protein [Myceligenerans salitolerans]MBO0609733.1 hypothetical protein [Myceligenerans salitolerans]
MKQAKTTRTSTATKQVRRVVATIALATAAGTAATPAFASESESDRGGEGIGRAFGADRPGAKFGGAERGVEVKDDGTVEVRSGGALGGVGNLVSDVVDDVTDIADDVTEHVTDGSADVVEDVAGTVDDVTEPAVDAVEDTTGSASAGETTGKASEGAGSGRSDGTSGAGKEGGGQGGGTTGGKPGPGEKAEGGSDADADRFAPVDIDYSADLDESVPEPATDGASGEIRSGELLAFEATAKALGFGPGTESDDRSGEHRSSDDYEPRHMKASPEPHDVERGSLDGRQLAKGERGSLSVASSDLLGGIGIGNVDLTLSASEKGVDVRVGAGGVTAEVEAGRTGVSVDADVPEVADVAVDANAQGVEASAGAAGVAKVGAEVTATGGTAAAEGAASGGATGVQQDVSELAQRTDRTLQGGAHSYLGHDARSALAPEGAEFLSYQPTTVDRVAEEADAATREATIDAPLRVATTGTEAAALTGLAGALVVGGAGALLVANRAGRNGETVPVRVPDSTS